MRYNPSGLWRIVERYREGPPKKPQPDLAAGLRAWSNRRVMIQRLDDWQAAKRGTGLQRLRWRDGPPPMKEPTQRSEGMSLPAVAGLTLLAAGALLVALLYGGEVVAWVKTTWEGWL